MSIATETPAVTGSWVTDPTHSSVGFTVLYMGVAPFQGAFREFEATLDEQGIRGVAQTSMLDACATPRTPCSSRVASNSRNAPWNGATPMY